MSTSVTTPSAGACNATRAAIRTSARGRPRTAPPGTGAATPARVPLQAQRQVSRRPAARSRHWRLCEEGIVRARGCWALTWRTCNRRGRRSSRADAPTTYDRNYIRGRRPSGTSTAQLGRAVAAQRHRGADSSVDLMRCRRRLDVAGAVVWSMRAKPVHSGTTGKRGPQRADAWHDEQQVDVVHFADVMDIPHIIASADRPKGPFVYVDYARNPTSHNRHERGSTHGAHTVVRRRAA